jgi:signal transduction histidine kinase/CheY-like chemotaxis protein
MVAGTAGAAAAVIVARGEHWTAMLLVAPIYLTYRTYQLFVGRLADEKRHKDEIQHLLEREQTARASAEDANRLKDQFLAVVSHELRTPLNAILGWADMLRRGTLAEPQRERAVRTIHNSAKRQAQLIEDLLDVARITSGKLRLERALVDLREVVRDALQIVQPGADVKRIRIAVDTDPAVVPLYGDAARLQQIVSNLLSNAVKFTAQGGAVHVRLRREGNLLELAVADNGQGISPAFLPWVFEPFRQADGSTTRVHSGLGLGLSIVKNLVEAHGGTVTAESAGDGCGATFTVRLPISLRSETHSSHAAEHAAPGADTAHAEASLEGVSVLVVDDDASSREVIAAHLQGCHAAVLTAPSAAHAFEMIHQRHVDVLIADIGMPDEDGYSLIRRIRAVDAPDVKSIPAAAVTAFAREEDRQRALQAGFQVHLSKPIDAPALVAAVANLRGARVATA